MLLGQRRVIDSNIIRSEELRQFLSLGAENFAILPDFIWFELYKQESTDAVVATLSVIGDFPEQIIALRSVSEIASINPRVLNITDSMEQSNVASNIREMVELITGSDHDSAYVRDQLKLRWGAAVERIPLLLDGADDIMTSLPEMAEQMFTQREIRIIRTESPYTSEMFASIFGAADQIWETVSENSDYRPWVLDKEHKTKTYLFRYSLAIVVYLLWWINNGSQTPKRLDRVQNDLIDLSFAVYGTYYDGLMTADRKAKWMHHQLFGALRFLGAKCRHFDNS